jgi:DDE_Tnp_1-associated
MRLVVPLSEIYKQYTELDRIHDPEIYKIDPNDRRVIDYTEQGKIRVEEFMKATSATNDVMEKPSLELPLHWSKRQALKAKIRENYRSICQRTRAVNATITPRTQAQNRKRTYKTIEEEREIRADHVAAQLRVWRTLLPTLIRKFSQIPDPRRVNSVKHQLVVLMIFGLMAFIFQLSSRREMNRELTGVLINEHLRKIFPEMDSIPHADTLARLLKEINPHQIEAAHIALIQELIRKKKFKKLLIQGYLPISIDGTQKLYREGELHDGRWCERKIGHRGRKQQYVYAIEANIIFPNGLNIPFMTEYLYRDHNMLTDPKRKQDSEITAFKRMAERLKKYFPRLKILLCMDALYATQNVMEIISKNKWEFLINLPRNKLTGLSDLLNQNKECKKMIPRQSHYRKRQQAFYWKNNVLYGFDHVLKIHLVACEESYEEVDKKTGEIVKKYSEHAWISSIALHLDNIHELCNLGARKKLLIEDNINTEKNRNYHYKHAFSYDWHVMQGFHYLMRLGHAINALSEFNKKLKKYLKENGCSATLKFIKETLFSPWLSVEWYEEQRLKTPQLRFHLE